MLRTRNKIDAPVTVAIIIITSLVFIVELFLSRNPIEISSTVLLDMGAKYAPLIDQGELLRFFAPIFLHSSWFHIFSNMITLYFIGRIAERQFGAFRYLSIYLISGIVGNIFSYLFSPYSLAVGASTSIFGIFGMLIMFGWLFWNQPVVRAQTTTFLVFVIWNIFTQLSSPTIDVWGHIGGLVGGFLLAFIFGFKNKADSKRILPLQRYLAIGGLLLIFFVVFMVVRP